MTEKQFKSLGSGDIIKHKSSDNNYMVTVNYGGRVTAIKTVDVTNPSEWDLLLTAIHLQPVKE